MVKKVQFKFEAFWGGGSAYKFVSDAEREVGNFFKAGCTPADLLDELNSYYRKHEDEAYRMLADPKGIPVAMAIDDYSRAHFPAASGLALGGNLRAVKHALARGADLERGDRDHGTALVAAAESCTFRDDDASRRNRDAARAVFYADAVKLVRFLIEQGANINEADGEGRTALMHAARAGHRELAKLLLANGADVWRQDKHGDTALHHAVVGQLASDASGGYSDVVGTVRTLLAGGASPTERNFIGIPVLHEMAINGEDRTRDEFDAILKMLLDAGATLEDRDREGWTPLLRAMRNERGAKILIPGFIDAGADTEAVTPQGSGVGRIGKEEAKRVLKASLMAKNIAEAMGDGEPARRRSAPKRDSFGVL